MAYLSQKDRFNPETGRKETYWMIADRVEGKQVARALGFISEKEAKRLLAIYQGERAKGNEPLKTSEPPSKGVTLADLWPRLIKRMKVEGAAVATLEQAGHCAKPLLRLLENLTLPEIRGEALDDYVLARKGEGRRARTIQIELRYLQRALQIAVEEGLLPALPKLPTLSLDDAKPHVWINPEQFEQLVAELPWTNEPVSALAAYTLLCTGARRGEIITRQWQDIDWTSGTLWIGPRIETGWQPKGKPGKRRGRRIPLPPALYTALQEHWLAAGKPPSGWIFPSSVKPGEHLQRCNKSLASACERAGLQRLHPHALRHSWATLQAMRGTPEATTKSLGGWSADSDILRSIYTHATDSSKLEAAQKASIPIPEPNREKKVLPFRKSS